MGTRLFWIVFLADAVFNVECTETSQSDRYMSKERAIETCAQTGGSLVNYASVTENPAGSVYLTQIVDGESAWINGFAKLSPFLARHGCFNTTHKDMKQAGLYKRATAKKSLYLCSQHCLTYKYSYMGMKDRTCYCFKLQQRHLIQSAAVNDFLCSITCDNNVVDSCGGQSFVSVYSIVEPWSMHWAENEPSKRQCVYVKRNQSRFDFHTASCHTFQTNMVNGFICMNSVHSRLETVNCTKVYSFCICDEPSTRQEAYMSCMNRHGKLADPSSESVIPQWMTHKNFKYWISVYRTFEIFERYIENKMVCLAAVRLNNTLYLEPDDCSEQKHYLCEVKTITQSSHYANVTSNTSPITGTTSETISISAAGTGYISPFAYIVPSILVVILLVIIVGIVLYRRRKKHANRLPHQSDTYITPQHETINSNNSDDRLDGGAMHVKEMERNEAAPYTELRRVRDDPEYSGLVDTANDEAQYINLH